MDPVQEELVEFLSPRRRAQNETTTTIGTAMSDSVQGEVEVEFDVSVLCDGEDYGQQTTITKLPTTVYCQEGDTVIISLWGSGGVKTPTVTGVSGGGDAINERVTAIEQSQPSGSISITENGTYDVTTYAEADVNVSGSGGGFDWTQLYRLPGFASAITSTCSGVNFDASGMWLRSGGSSSSSPPAGFRGATELKTFTIGTMDMSGCLYLEYMFNGCTKLTDVDFHFSSAPVLRNTQYMFYGCTKLETVDFRFSSAPSFTSMYHMFDGCTKLTDVDMSTMDRTHTYDMSSMFRGCTSLVSPNVDLSLANKLEYAFYGCTALNIDLSQIDFTNNTLFSYAFYGCTSMPSQIDFSGRQDLANVTGMGEMFRGCTQITSVDFSGADLSSVTSTTGMFRGCTSLTHFDSSGFTLPSFDDRSSYANGTYYTFYGCTSLQWLDGRAWDQYKGVGQYFCYNCTSLESACFTNTRQVMGNAFQNCSSLVCLIWLATNTPLGYGSNRMTNSGILNGNGYIYVRDSKLNDYLNNSHAFNDCKAQIKPISQCPQQYLDLYDIDPNDYQ